MRSSAGYRGDMLGVSPLWVAVVCWQTGSFESMEGHVAVLRPRDSLVPVYDRGSAGIVAFDTLCSARKLDLVPQRGVAAAFLFDRRPDFAALAARAGGVEYTRVTGLIGLMQFKGDMGWEVKETALRSPT